MKSRHLSVWVVAFVIALALGVTMPAGLFADPASRADDSPNRSSEKKTDKTKKKQKTKSSKRRSKKAKARGKASEPQGKLVLKEIPADERREAKFLRDLGEGFKIRHTRHYTIFYNTNEKDVDRLAMSIEKIYTQVAKYIHRLGIQVQEPKKKLITHYFDTFEEYSNHSARTGHGVVQEGAMGFYVPVSFDSDGIDPLANMTFFYNVRNTPWFRGMLQSAEARLKAAKDRNKAGRFAPGERKALAQAVRAALANLSYVDNQGFAITEGTLQHEITHQVLFNVGFHNFGAASANPRWLAEGMAQIFETPSDGKNWGVALVNHDRLKGYRALVQHNALAPIRSFVSNVKWFRRNDQATLAYPQSWSIIHYVSRKKRDDLKKYVDLLNARPVDFVSTPEIELNTFEEAFGKLDERWEQGWLSYMESIN